MSAMPSVSSVAWSEPAALVGVKSRKRAIMRVALADCDGDALEISLCSRSALAGLSEKDLVAWRRELQHSGSSRNECAQSDSESDDGEPRWNFWIHADVKVMMITADQPLDEQFQRTISAAPHVLVVEAEVLSADVCGIFTDFTGGLLVVETSQLAFGKRCLCDLRINSRWRLVEQKSLVCEPCKVLLEDVRFDEDEEAATSEGTPLAGLTDVMKEQFAPLYIEEFGLGSLSPFGNLKRTQDGYGLRLSFLVTPAQDADDVPELLGFLAYKSWGGRKPGVSIAATAVPDIHQRKGLGRLLMSVAQAKAAAAGYGQEKPGCVFLRSLPTAVGFYLRIGARAFHHDGSEVLDVEAIDTDEDAPCVPMELECPPVDRPCWPAVDENTHEPWSPRRAAHLEDGPTWLPLESLLALPMAGA